MSLQIVAGQTSTIPLISFAYNAAFTIQFWQKIEGDGGSNQRIGSVDGRINHWGDTARYYSLNASEDRLIANSSTPNNTWTHYTLASDGATLRLYINGVLDVSGAVNAADIAYSVDYLATTSGGATQKLSEVRFYNIELDATAVSNNWDSRSSNNETGLVRRYPLNEASGTTLGDNQTNTAQQNGATGAATWDTGDDPSFAASAPSLSSPTATAIYTNSVTLGASTDQLTGQAWAVFDTAANMSGITEAQIKAGQNANSLAAVGSGTVADVSVGGSPISIAIGSLSMTIGDIYTYAFVQNNAIGDSNILTATFEVVGLDITGSDGTLTPGTTATIAVEKAGTTQGTVEATDTKGRVVALNITSWPTATGDGNIVVDIPSVFTSELHPGTVTLTVENSAQDDSDTVAATLVVDPGFNLLTVVSQDTDADEYLGGKDAGENPVAIPAGSLLAVGTHLQLVSDDSITALNPFLMGWCDGDEDGDWYRCYGHFISPRC